MHYVYILRSDLDKELYIGCTKDLKQRFVMHNSGKVSSTKKRGKLKLIHYEAFLNKYDAYYREQFLKTGWGHNHIYKLLGEYLKAKNFGG